MVEEVKPDNAPSLNVLIKLANGETRRYSAGEADYLGFNSTNIYPGAPNTYHYYDDKTDGSEGYSE